MPYKNREKRNLGTAPMNPDAPIAASNLAKWEALADGRDDMVDPDDHGVTARHWGTGEGMVRREPAYDGPGRGQGPGLAWSPDTKVRTHMCERESPVHAAVRKLYSFFDPEEHAYERAELYYIMMVHSPYMCAYRWGWMIAELWDGVDPAAYARWCAQATAR